MNGLVNPAELTSQQVEVVPTDLITIVNEDVLAMVRVELQSALDRGRYSSREAWARAVLENAEPVELYEQCDGRLELLDGNHRYLASTILRRPLPAIIIRSATHPIQRNPISRPAKTALLVAASAAVGAAVLYVITRPSKSQPLVTRGSRVALIGDSLAVGLGPELAKLAAKDQVVWMGEGHSGTTPLQWATHAKACGQCGDWLADFKPNVVLVVLGTNDLGYVTPPANYYEQIRNNIQALGATVVWVQPNTMSRSTLAAVRKVINGLGVKVVPEAQVPIAGDGVHPTSIGFNVWAQKIWRYLTSES